ncbi:MAG: hypothetical protein HEEMFOPI_01780 [Holosporales bacterium]
MKNTALCFILTFFAAASFANDSELPTTISSKYKIAKCKQMKNGKCYTAKTQKKKNSKNTKETKE